MTPTPSDVHVNGPLTNVLVAFMQDAGGFVADRVFPNINVAKQSDLYFKYDRSDWWRDSFRKRAPGAESAGGGWKVSTDTYYAPVWALHKDIDDQVRSNADNPINMDRDSTMFLAMQAMINREVNFATNFFTTSLWTGSTTATDIVGASSHTTDQDLRWNNASSTPIQDIREQGDSVKMKSGYRPNKLVIGAQVWTALSQHPDIVDRVKYGSSNAQPAIVSKQAVAALLEIDEVLVMDSVKVTTNENPAFETTYTTAFIGGKNALLVYANPAPSILQPSGGYTFNWTGYLGAQANGARVSTFRMDALKSDRVESEMAYAQKLVAAEMGTFWTGIVD